MDDLALRTATDIGVREPDPYGTRHTTTGRPVVPEALAALLRALHVRYPRLPPVWITENGSAEADTVGPDGRVHDTARIEYLADHLAAVAEAVSAGVDVRGYYVWSLLDNFEWARGYGQRFVLVHADYDTLTRTPKDSYHWFRALITAHRARTEKPPDEVHRWLLADAPGRHRALRRRGRGRPGRRAPDDHPRAGETRTQPRWHAQQYAPDGRLLVTGRGRHRGARHPPRRFRAAQAGVRTARRAGGQREGAPGRPGGRTQRG